MPARTTLFLASLVLLAPALNACYTPTHKVTDLDVDFSTFASGSLDSFLETNQLHIANYTVGSAPLTHTFVKSNVDVVDGALRLKVTGQSDNSDVKSAQITTTAANIRYGTFTTIAKLTPVPGVCAGFFTYTDDNHEIDIEALSSYYTEGYGTTVQPGLELTNQALVKGQPPTTTAVPYGFDPTADFHNYTILWTATSSMFYVDGQLRSTYKENVPKIGAAFLWNAWSNGNVNWSAGPPSEDSYTLIKEVHLAYTTV